MSKTKRYKFSCHILDANRLVENRDLPMMVYSTFIQIREQPIILGCSFVFLCFRFTHI